jgi:anion-transporting  ArsA/GET3 family ATPase
MTLLDKRLIVMAGKGGVGRTTVAAALALIASQKGKRVLLCQTKSREQLSRLFDCKPVGTELERVRERLWAVNMTPQAALREYGTMVLRSEFIAKRVLENKISRAFLHAIPGLEDYSMLGKTWYHTTEEESEGRPKWDLVIFDGPATGHLVTMLRIPQVILATVPEGPLTRPAAEVKRLLEDPARACVVLVTLAEDLPTNEAIELEARIRSELNMAIGALMVNALYPKRFAEGASARALAALLEPCGDLALEPLLSAARTAARRRALNEEYLAKLGGAISAPSMQLPYVFRTNFGPSELGDLARFLEPQLG